MRIGLGVLACAMLAAGGAEAQDVAGQMRAGFDVCADFVAERTDFHGAVAAANTAGFPGDGGDAMYWTRPEDGARVRLSLAISGNGWCAVSTTGTVDEALPDRSMGWAAERLSGPWRHARQTEPTAGNLSAVTGFNGRIDVVAARQARGGIRIDLGQSTRERWDQAVTRLGAQPTALELPAYNPPAPAAPAGPPLRNTVLGVLAKCRAFIDGGERPATIEEGTGVRLTLADPSGPRACAVEVTATPTDLTLMEAGLRIVEAGRGFNHRRQETGFSCMMHQVTLETARLSAIAACDRLALRGQPWLSFQLAAR